MNETPQAPWIHVGECPVCVNGLCRIRTCCEPSGSTHFYAMCDECEATWLQPDTGTPKSFPDAEHPQCPICQAPLYGEQAHWALSEELSGSEWEANAIFDVPSSVAIPLPENGKLPPESEAPDHAEHSSDRTPLPDNSSPAERNLGEATDPSSAEETNEERHDS